MIPAYATHDNDTIAMWGERCRGMRNRKRLHLNQARAIVAVAQCGSLAKAATLLHCSQSVVSRVIASAERLVGDALFHRTWNSTRPTDMGGALFPRCKRAIDRVIAIEESLAAETGARRNLALLLKWQHFEAVTAIVRLGSATLAAAHLGSTQPTISKTVTELSRYANVVLFKRTRAGLEPTSFAIAIASLHDELACDLDVTIATLPPRTARRGERLSIGVSPFGGQRIVSQAISQLMGRHDISHLSTTHGEYHDLCRALRLGEIDCVIGALRGPAASPTLSEVYLYPEEFHLFVAERRIADGASSDLEHLKNRTWLVGPEGTPARLSFNAFFDGLGIGTPDKIFEMYSFTDAENIIDNSESIGLLCYSQPDLRRLAPRLRPLAFDLPIGSARIGLTLNKSISRSAILEDFEKVIKHAAMSDMY